MGFWFIMYHEKIVEALNHQSHNHYYFYGLLWFTNNPSIKSNQSSQSIPKSLCLM